MQQSLFDLANDNSNQPGTVQNSTSANTDVQLPRTDVKLAQSWKNVLAEEFSKEYFSKLIEFVKAEYKSYTVYPPGANIFSAFEWCSFEDTKVVIIGQDPYHGPNQANGLAFSVKEGIAIPPSLQNIFAEIRSDLGKPVPASGNLERWAKQGVLLLNATLTVRARTPGSHQNKGWEEFTDAVISVVNERKQNLVFMLWGAYAQRKGEIIDRAKHFILTAPHPSPFSVHKGFFGSKHFSQANKYLKEHGLEPIDW